MNSVSSLTATNLPVGTVPYTNDNRSYRSYNYENLMDLINTFFFNLTINYYAATRGLPPIFPQSPNFSTGGSDNPSNSTAQRSIADPQLVARACFSEVPSCAATLDSAVVVNIKALFDSVQTGSASNVSNSNVSNSNVSNRITIINPQIRPVGENVFGSIFRNGLPPISPQSPNFSTGGSDNPSNNYENLMDLINTFFFNLTINYYAATRGLPPIFPQSPNFSTGGSDNPSNSTAQRSIADPQLVARACFSEVPSCAATLDSAVVVNIKALFDSVQTGSASNVSNSNVSNSNVSNRITIINTQIRPVGKLDENVFGSTFRNKN